MLNRQERNDSPDYMKIAKENIYKQAGMAGMAVVVTIVLIFAMTVAWYSNVVHTDDLVFQASSWKFDFEGAIEIETEMQVIAPGDSGIVNLQLTNDSDEAITVLANAPNDANVSELMRERIYFYVDDSQIINGEVVDRIYVNETDEYAYTVLGKNTLVLNETYHSAAYLKWEWVYDVLGYYVSGSVQDNGSVTIDDYMRPVVYDYDKAMFDSNGNLLTVEGGTSKAEFLQELFETDGYAGRPVTTPTAKGYYPVVVDEDSGYGIWLYLSTKREIEYATGWDNQISKGDTDGEQYSFSGRLLLSGQQKRDAEVQVTTAGELETQLNASAIGKVTLGGNLTLSDTIQVTDAKKVVLDLNGKTLTVPGGKNGVEVAEGSSLTVLNGDVVGAGNGVAFQSVGGEVTLSKVKVSNVARAVHVEDYKGAGMDSRIKITDCNLAVSDVAVMLRGNGDASARKTYLLIEDSIITSNNMAIVGNGNDTQKGTDIEIIGSEVSGGWAGIYHPQRASSMRIIDSTITGYTALTIKGGSVTIKDTTLHGTGDKQEPKIQVNGFTDTGDAIFVETGYNTDILLHISGNKTVLKSNKSYALQVFEANSKYVSVSIAGGKYSSDITKYLAKGYTYTTNTDGYCVVGEEAASSN